MLVAEHARERVSEITEMTEEYVVPAFDWERDYGSLYRDCPSAFWLAPDGSRQIVPVEEPRRPQVLHLAPRPQAEPEPAPVSGRVAGSAIALGIAGPMFLATTMFVDGLDQGVLRSFGMAGVSAVAMPFTVPIGALLALLPVICGVLTLSHFGIREPIVREPWVWTMVGTIMGIAIAVLFGAGAAVGLGLIATSAACARISRAGVEWHDPEVI